MRYIWDSCLQCWYWHSQNRWYNPYELHIFIDLDWWNIYLLNSFLVLLWILSNLEYRKLLRLLSSLFIYRRIRSRNSISRLILNLRFAIRRRYWECFSMVGGFGGELVGRLMGGHIVFVMLFLDLLVHLLHRLKFQ